MTKVLCVYGFKLNVMQTDNVNIQLHRGNYGIYAILHMRSGFFVHPHIMQLETINTYLFFCSNKAKTMVSSSYVFSITAKPKRIEMVVLTIT